MPLTTEILQKYVKNIFVETGSRWGGGIRKALKVGFKEIHSIEVREKPFYNCQRMFYGNKKVKLYFGDSSKILWDVIKDIDEPATFWLDAHTEDSETDYNAFPVAKELDIIASHPIKTHTIIVDDLNCTEIFGSEYHWVVDVIKKINQGYVFEFYKSERGLLAATI